MAVLPRCPAEILQHLLDHGTWYVSAIELDYDQNGEVLEQEARASVLAFREQFKPGVVYVPLAEKGGS